ncbi:hypothetical protein [Kribbella deserti]|uniref:Uncharacterized protein n=1 Tax=Kribbella deserti TaxID=1926257 RepID=A0ABV6QUW1_9ACTN
MAGETTVAAFNNAYLHARDRVEADGGRTLAAEQEVLRRLVPGLAKESERQWAERMIASLATAPQPEPEPGPLYLEASAIQGQAFSGEGTTEQRIEALVEARRQIFELASHAPADEAPHIRGLARVLEHLEDALRNPAWYEEPRPPQGG